MKPPKGKFAATARVGEKGQIVIPKGARDLLNIRPGDIALTKDEVVFQQLEGFLSWEEEP